MDSITLNVQENSYTSASEARNAGMIPVIYYGKGVENKQLTVEYQDFRRAFEKGGRSTIMNFVTDDKKEYPVLIHEIQYHPVSDEIMHVDVTAVDMNKPITTQVPIVYVGVAPAVKEEGGILVHNKDTVDVQCLPKDLVHEIEVSIEGLVDLNSSLSVGDLTPPAGIEILDDPAINLIMVATPRSATEDDEAPAAEGEEGGEGEAAEAPEGEKAEGGEEGGEGGE